MAGITNYISGVFTVPVKVYEYDNQPKLISGFRKVNSLADYALQPVRYFFGNNPLVQIQYRARDPKEVYEIHYEYPKDEKNWKTTLLMIAAFIPGLILGTIGKLIAQINSQVRHDIQTASDALQFERQKTANLKISTNNLAPDYAIVFKEGANFYKFLQDNKDKGQAIWKEQDTLKKFDSVFNKAALFMDKLFQELERCGQSNPEKMAQTFI